MLSANHKLSIEQQIEAENQSSNRSIDHSEHLQMRKQVPVGTTMRLIVMVEELLVDVVVVVEEVVVILMVLRI